MELELPQPTVRLNFTRANNDYSDIGTVIADHFRTYQSAEAYIGPYNARQRNSKMYIAPNKEELQRNIKRGGMNELTYLAFIASLERFCEKTQGNRALPAPHPNSLHSAQFNAAAFNIEKNILLLPKCEGIRFPDLRYPEKMNYVIIRPKLGKLGTASLKNWEALFFEQNFGYIPNWVDSTLNPRYSGIL